MFVDDSIIFIDVMRVMLVATVARYCVTWYQSVATMVNVWNLTCASVIVDTQDLNVHYSLVKLGINVLVRYLYVSFHHLHR